MTERKPTGFAELMASMTAQPERPESAEFDAADYADQAVTILNTVRKQLVDSGWTPEIAEHVAVAAWQRGSR